MLEQEIFCFESWGIVLPIPALKILYHMIVCCKGLLSQTVCEPKFWIDDSYLKMSQAIPLLLLSPPLPPPPSASPTLCLPHHLPPPPSSHTHIHTHTLPNLGRKLSGQWGSLSNYMAKVYFQNVTVLLLVATKKWLLTPGWSTSWTALAKMAARTSRSVKTD